jgi:hypothetical protein
MTGDMSENISMTSEMRGRGTGVLEDHDGRRRGEKIFITKEGVEGPIGANEQTRPMTTSSKQWKIFVHFEANIYQVHYSGLSVAAVAKSGSDID